MSDREEISSSADTVVTLLADPHAPTEIARHLAERLPTRLADKSGEATVRHHGHQ